MPGPSDAPSRAPLAVLLAVAVLAAVAMAVLWSTARGDARNIASERDALIEERDLATDVNVALNTKLQVAQAQLETAEEELVDALAAADPSAPAGEGDVADATNRVAELEAEVERLSTENETLAADLFATGTGSGDAPTTSSASAPPVFTAPATTTTTTEPAEVSSPETSEPSGEPLTPAQAGSQLAGLYRPDVLGPGQELCLGEVVSNDLGANRLTILLRGSDPASSDALRTSMEAAAAFCAIDPSAVFN